MDRISRTELRSLAATKTDAAVSVFLPLERGFSGAKQNLTRYRHMVDRIEPKLNGELRSPEVREMLRPVRELEEDSVFWKPGTADGLGVLAASGVFRVFPLPYRCPEIAEVGHSFHLAPLAHVLAHDDRFHLLALTPKSVRLFRGRGRTLEPVALPADMPKNMEEALPGVELERTLQMHTSSTRGVAGGGAAIHHGHGTPKDDTKPMLRDYFHIICRHVESILSGDHSPLVLAAVQYSHSLFRECCRYPNIVEPGVIGNPDDMTDRELLDRALPSVSPWFARDLTKAADRFRSLIASPRAGESLHAIVPAAVQGRVEVLFSALGEHRYGVCDEDGSHVSLHPHRENGDRDLLDLALRHTILHGGETFVVPQSELPTDSPVAAIFRW